MSTIESMNTMDSSTLETKKKRKKRSRNKQKSHEPSSNESGTGTPASTSCTCTRTTDEAGSDGPPIKNKNKRRKQTTKPLNGLVVAVSTQEKKNINHDANSKDENSDETANNDDDVLSIDGSKMSYREVCSLCERLGASTSSQVHKRVVAVICNKSAILQCTQRVRKALKRHIMLIDVKWLLACEKEGSQVDYESYLLTDLAKDVVANRKRIEDEKAQSGPDTGVDVQDESDEEILNNTSIGWSEPVALDCCCVCHDDDRDDCKWCCGDVKCNIILRKLAEAKT